MALTRKERLILQPATTRQSGKGGLRTLERHSGLVKEAKQALTAEFERLQQRVLELETEIDTKAGYL